VLAGRDAERLRSLAERLDLRWVAGAATEVAALVGDARLVLLAAGPFGATAPQVLQACLDAGVHYLDIANEIPVVTAALAADETARRRGITVLPSVGFGTMASDGLAAYVADQVPGATTLDIAILLGTDGSSAGARASRTRAMAGGGWVRRSGRLVRSRMGAGAHRQTTPMGDRTLVPAPTADLVVSGHTTSIPDITVSIPVSMPPLAATLVMPVLPFVARVSRLLPTRAAPADPTKEPDKVESYLWARATAPDGQTAEAWIKTGEGYAYTARSAVLAVEATLQAEALGATTVARAFGPALSFAAGGELVGTA
jgi:short subunit dehydrogenase-like uncharacterized protein